MNLVLDNRGSLSDLSALSGRDLSDITSLDYLLYNCAGVTDLAPLAGWDVSHVTSMNGTFRGCGGVSSLDPLSGWDVSHVQNLSGMFYDCGGVTSLAPLSGWDVSNVTDMAGTFEYCSSLTEATELACWDVSHVTDMLCLFCGCRSLETLDLSGWDTSRVHNINNMFYGCTGLRTVTLGSKFSFTGDGASSCALPVPCRGATPGRWVSDTGETFDRPSQIPGNTAATYRAVFDAPSTRFPDVADAGAWYHDAVYEMVAHGYLNGRADGSFGVGAKVTRAEFITVLWRIARPSESATYVPSRARNLTGLADVRGGMYYTGAVNWAMEKGVAGVRGNGRFGTNDPIAFEEMCLYVARQANGGADGLQASMNDDAARRELGRYEDASEVSPEAVKGVVWCIGAGLVSGIVGRELRPKAAVTREQMASVLWRAIDGGMI